MDKKVIVYGLGKEYERQKTFIQSEFTIVGYSDKNRRNEPLFIEPQNIVHEEFDYIYVTSRKFFSEIKQELMERKVDSHCIIGMDDVWGNFPNAKVRDDWVIARLSEIADGATLLDAGAGEMKYAPYCNRLHYIAQDFGKYDNSGSDKGLQFEKWDTSRVHIVCDIVEMPLEDASVDVILCTEVLEHLKNPTMAIKEFSRILKHGGKLLLTAPFCSLTHMAPFYFANGFSEYWYLENLKDYGFEIEKTTPYGNYFEWLGQELYRVEEMAEKYCDVKLSGKELSPLLESIKLMSRLSLENKGSEECLCFGYMVEAHRI